MSLLKKTKTKVYQILTLGESSCFAGAQLTISGSQNVNFRFPECSFLWFDFGYPGNFSKWK